MIDDKTLAEWEQDAIDYDLPKHAVIYRLARRYLALRNAAKTQEGRVRCKLFFGTWEAAKTLTQPLTGCWRVGSDDLGRGADVRR